MLKKFKTFLQCLPFRQEETYPMQIQKIGENDYLIRKMAREDVKELIDVQRMVYDGKIPWTRSAFLSELLSALPHLYLCVEHSERLVGFIGCRLSDGDGHITNIAILPAYQGKGLGTFLLKEIEAYAIKNQCTSLSLEVRLGNREAQRLYRKVGFVSRAVKNGYYDETNEDTLDMVKYINE